MTDNGKIALFWVNKIDQILKVSMWDCQFVKIWQINFGQNVNKVGNTEWVEKAKGTKQTKQTSQTQLLAPFLNSDDYLVVKKILMNKDVIRSE